MKSPDSDMKIKLPDGITGDRRNVVIHQFQKCMGTRYVPKNVHTSIRWDGQDPLDELAVTTDTPWQLVKHNKKKISIYKSNVTGFVAAKGTASVASKKHKLDDNDTEQVNKKS